MSKEALSLLSMLDGLYSADPSEREAVIGQIAPRISGGRALLERMLSVDSSRAPSILDDPAIVHMARDLAGLPRRIGRYEIIGELGSGGMGSVYLAFDRLLERQVAVKTVLPLQQESDSISCRFKREARVLAELRHRGIAAVHDIGQSELETADGRRWPQTFIVMEHVDGITLDEHLSDKTVSQHETLVLFRRLCDSIAYAHSKQIIHRDLKPSNILVGKDGIPVVVDFGIAKILKNESVSGAARTQVGALLGTVGYMSPEIIEKGSVVATRSSDVYSLGVILYKLLSGRLPIQPEAATLPGFVQQVYHQDPTPIERIAACPRDLSTIVGKALAKEPFRRYADAREFADDIIRYLEHKPIQARRPTLQYRVQRWLGRNQTISLVVFIAMIFLGGAAGFSFSKMVHAKQERDRAKEETVRANRERARADQEKVRANLENRQRGATLQFLETMLAAADRGAMRGRDDVPVREVVEWAAQQLDEGSLAGEPVVEAAIRTTLGITYHALGLFTEARRQLRCAVDLRSATIGLGARDTWIAQNRLSMALVELGEIDEAAEICEEIWRQMELAAETESLDAADVQSQLGVIYMEQGRLEEALKRAELAVDLRRLHLGDDHDEVASGLINRGAVRTALDDRPGAAADFSEALRIRRASLRSDDPRIAVIIHNLGALAMADGRIEEAEARFRKALDVRARILGEDHPETLESASDLAAVLGQRQEFGAAAALFVRTIEAQRRVYDTNHSSLARSLMNFGALRRREDRLEDADELLTEAVAILEATAPRSTDAASACSLLAELRSVQDQLDEAEELHRKSLHIRRVLLGDTAAVVGLSWRDLGELLLQRNKLTESEHALREFLAIASKGLYSRALVAHTEGALGRVVFKQGRRLEGEELMLGAHAQLEQLANEVDPLFRRISTLRLYASYREWCRADPTELRRRQVDDWKAALQVFDAANPH